MANFDEDIKRITDEIIQDGTVEKIIKEKITKGFESAIDSAFSFGKLRDAIRKRTDEVLVPLIYTEFNPDITSLRYLDDFDVYLLKLQRANVKVIVDKKSDWDSIISENEPEAIYE